jgi:ethanolamine utilization protein EutP (predicted NTPase)
MSDKKAGIWTTSTIIIALFALFTGSYLTAAETQILGYRNYYEVDVRFEYEDRPRSYESLFQSCMDIMAGYRHDWYVCEHYEKASVSGGYIEPFYQDLAVVDSADLGAIKQAYTDNHDQVMVAYNYTDISLKIYFESQLIVIREHRRISFFYPDKCFWIYANYQHTLTASWVNGTRRDISGNIWTYYEEVSCDSCWTGGLSPLKEKDWIV